MAITITGDLATIITSSATALGVLYTAYKQYSQDRKLAAAAELQQQANALQIANHGILATVANKVAEVGNATAINSDVISDITSKINLVQTNVAKVELATNSMKDALVRTTAAENLLKGRAEGIKAEKERAGADPAGAQPDAAPTVVDIADAHADQAKATATDTAMRVSEKETRKP